MAETVIVANSPTVLQVANGGLMAGNVSVQDLGGYYGSDNVEGALAEIGESLNQIDVDLELLPVISRRDSPGTETLGNRYLILPNATGEWIGQDNNIAEWDGAQWVYTIPIESNIVYVTGGLVTLRFNGSSWLTWGGIAIKHNGQEMGNGIVIGTNNSTPMTFKTNNENRVKILSTGEIGIGTDSPTKDFEVAGDASSLQYDSAYQTLAYSASIAWDMASGQASKLTLTGDALIGNPTNKESITPILEVLQDGVGGHTLTFDTDFAEVDISQVTTAANSITVYAFIKGSDGNFRGQGKTFSL